MTADRSPASPAYQPPEPGRASSPGDGLRSLREAHGVRAITNERPVTDGERYPWVEDLDGLWHLRPKADTWRSGEVQAQTVCGRLVGSVHVSGYMPDPPRCGSCTIVGGTP